MTLWPVEGEEKHPGRVVFVEHLLEIPQASGFPELPKYPVKGSSISLWVEGLRLLGSGISDSGFGRSQCKALQVLPISREHPDPCAEDV